MIQVLGILLVLLGLGCIGFGNLAFGDIGVAAMMAGGSALLSGIAVVLISRRIKAVQQKG